MQALGPQLAAMGKLILGQLILQPAAATAKARLQDTAGAVLGLVTAGYESMAEAGDKAAVAAARANSFLALHWAELAAKHGAMLDLVRPPADGD